MKTTVADYRWLTEAAADRYLTEAATTDKDPLALVTWLRKSLTPVQAHLIAEQVVLRRRAEQKFSHAHQMLFTPVGLQQATGDALALYKTSRFARDQRLADLCCGLGGDLIALAEAGTAEGVEQDEITALLCAHNLVACDRAGLVTCGDATEIDLQTVDAWHMDPDRRPLGKRTVDPVQYTPSLDQIAAMLSVNPHAGIKLAPAADFHLPHEEHLERQWLGWGRECQQQLVWSGSLTRHAGLRSASVVDDVGCELGCVVGSGREPVTVMPLGPYLVEPHAAVIAARLVNAFAVQEGLGRIDEQTAYLTGNQPTRACGAVSFQVLDALPFDERNVRAALKQRGLYPAEVKKRRVDIEPQQLSRRLRACGDDPCVLILAPGAGRTWAIIAKRVDGEQEAA